MLIIVVGGIVVGNDERVKAPEKKITPKKGGVTVPEASNAEGAGKDAWK